MYRMYGRNVFSCRNVNLYEKKKKKGMGARFREDELSSSQDMHGSLDFPSPLPPLFLIWVWLFEICKKKGMDEGQFDVQKLVLSQAPTLPASQDGPPPARCWNLQRSQEPMQSPPSGWAGKNI